MLTIGITGGIGSGKTSASDYFTSHGIHVVDADIISREVVEPNEPAWQAIKDRYGDAVLNQDGSLNRPWLRQKVFADPSERKWLESQTHPRIRESIINQLAQARSPYAILVSPLLFEARQNELVDRTLVIDVEEEVQVARACSRDQNDKAQIRRIIAAQMPRKKRLSLADDMADNSMDLIHLYRQLDLLHSRYLRLAEQ